MRNRMGRIIPAWADLPERPPELPRRRRVYCPIHSPGGVTFMNTQEQKAILTIAMMAAFADGRKDDAEREAIRHVAETLGREAGGGGLAGLYQDVLLQRVRLVDAAPLLKEPGQRQLAYEMAVCVCDEIGRAPSELQ